MEYLIVISILLFVGVSKFYKQKIETELNEIPDGQHYEEFSPEENENDDRYNTEDKYSEENLMTSLEHYQSDSFKEYLALQQEATKAYKPFEGIVSTNNEDDNFAQNSSNSDIVNNFDIRKAIIYSEILTPRN